jgi:3-carboxy-cis,cis-muconate cycloisomerase
MPHKRNPVSGAAVLSAAIRVPHLVGSILSAMPQDHERGLGGWHAEWEVLPELVRLAAGATAQVADVCAGLEVDAARMRANIDKTHGLIMAEAVMMTLGAKIGRLAAHDLIEAACHRAVAEKRHLRDVLAGEAGVTAYLDAAALDRLFDPLGYVGTAPVMVDRVLAARRK